MKNIGKFMLVLITVFLLTGCSLKTTDNDKEDKKTSSTSSTNEGGDSDIRQELIVGFVYSLNDETCYGGTCVSVTRFDDECFSNDDLECSTDKKYEVTVKAGKSGKEYTIYTDNTYKKLDDSNNYVFAAIEDGCLVVGLAK